VTVQAADAPDGTGVKQITFSATGAQTIRRTTVPGSTAVLPPITAEGLTTVSYFATDEAGNAEPFKRLVIKLDKTPPEAATRFDPAAQDLVVLGRDALSGVAPGAIVPVSVMALAESDPEETEALDPTVLTRGVLRTYRVVDAAGNTLQVTISVRTRAHLLRAQIASLQYNAAAALTPPRNSARFQWQLTSAGQLKELQQLLKVEDADAEQAVQAQFDARPNAIRTPASLVLLELRTDRGALLITL
jgi:hypothetical protein